MGRDSRKDGRRETEAERYGPETIELGIRERVRDVIERIVEEELEATLGARPSERVGSVREGYRHGHRERTLTTSLGATSIDMPRARLQGADGGTAEWQSRTVRRYERRTKRVDEAILGVYLSGTNTRRIKGALAPLLRGGPLSKDAVSRLVGRLAGDFKKWRERDLAKDDIRYLFMDGWYPKVRLGKRRVRVPVLVTLGVRGNGQRVLLDMQLAGDESSAAWGGVIEDLVRRHIGTPALAVIDGNPGLATALREQWPALPIQRCTVHKLPSALAFTPDGTRLYATYIDYRALAVTVIDPQTDSVTASIPLPASSQSVALGVVAGTAGCVAPPPLPTATPTRTRPPSSTPTRTRTPTVTPPPPPCVGDCDGDDVVTVDELITGLRIALGSVPREDCWQFDPNSDGQVTIDELVAAVNRALRGCG